MRVRGCFIGLSTAIVVCVSGIMPISQPSKSPDDQSSLDVPGTPYNDGWAPEATAGGSPIRKPAAPEEAWDGVLGEGSELRRVPSGTVLGAPGLGAPYFAFDETEVSVSTGVRVNPANGNVLMPSSEGMLNGRGQKARNDPSTTGSLPLSVRSEMESNDSGRTRRLRQGAFAAVAIWAALGAGGIALFVQQLVTDRFSDACLNSSDRGDPGCRRQWDNGKLNDLRIDGDQFRCKWEGLPRPPAISPARSES